MTLEPGAKLGPYEILEPLGTGGMGEVYRALDARLGRNVAVKVLPADVAAGPQRVARFEREARAVAALSHPNILSIFDIGREADVSYVVFELLEGESLRDRLRHRRLNWRSALDISIGIVDGLAAAHSRGIIHRDLKPENLFLTTDGIVKILDFGLACAQDPPPPGTASGEHPTVSAGTLPGTILGTAGYMSPEQVGARPATESSDLFSFGCVLYEMLSGRRAFDGDSLAEVSASILRDEPAALAEGGSRVPPEVERLVLRCLEKKPEDRFDSARDLGFALRTLASSASDSVAGASDAGARVGSLAVLPLRNLAGDPAEDFFADGMTEALIADLSGIEGLRVTSRSGAMQYRGVNRPLREIARELDVEAVVEGSVLRSGPRVRITVELVNARTGTNLWAQSYEREMEDILRLQGEVACAIVGEIRAKLSPRMAARLDHTRRVDPEALEAYLKGRYYWNRRTEETVKRGIEFFHAAIDIDPTYAEAFAGLADSYNILGFYYCLAPKEAFPRAKTAALRALELDPSLTDVHALVGYICLYHDWAGASAEKEFRAALEAHPRSAENHRYYGNFLAAQGRLEEGLVELEEACRLDPLSLINSSALAWVHYFRRDYGAALRQSRNTLEMDRTFALGHLFAGGALQMMGRHDEAVAALSDAAKFGGSVPLTQAHLAHACALAGREDEARALLADLQAARAERYVSSYLEALVHLGLGDRETALELLDRACDERAHILVFLDVEAKMDPLRSDPRFAAVRRRVATESISC